MSIIEYYNLEKEGLSKTIENYTVNNYIKSYSKQLLTLDPSEDIDRIKIIVERLIEWYEENMEVIQNSNFVFNKECHIKSLAILKELKGKLI